MENKIMMPASYNVLSCEEMTYTEGGATVGQAVAAWLCKGNVTNTFYHAGMIFWNAASTISSFGLSAVMSLGIIYF